jgi:polar amino acid transport system substrate-binding protein
VFGAIACTTAVAFAFGAVLWSRNRIAATFVRWLVLFFRSSPIVLLLFVGFTAATVVTQYSLAVALIVAIITLGLFNGSYAAQAVADVRAELVREREGVPPRFRLLASRAATPLTGFLINASKGSAAASMIGAPELLSATTDISSFSSERLSLYSLLLVLYLALVLLVIGLCKVLRRVLLRLEHAA